MQAGGNCATRAGCATPVLQPPCPPTYSKPISKPTIEADLPIEDFIGAGSELPNSMLQLARTRLQTRKRIAKSKAENEEIDETIPQPTPLALSNKQIASQNHKAQSLNRNCKS